MRIPLVIVAWLVSFAPLRALEPSEIVIVANRLVPSSREVAEHYATKRGVPKANIIEISLSRGEDISRAEYDRQLVGTLRETLSDRKETIKCLLTVYGVPLRVGAKLPSAEEKEQLAELKEQLAVVKKGIADLEKKPNPDAVDLLAARSDLRRLTEREMTLSHQESNACVDSELMLLWWTDYPLARWVPNPQHWQFPAEKRKKSMPPVLLVSRLDGPTSEIAKRLVDDAVEVEETGLSGKVYVDARGMNFDPKNANDKGYGYGGYDESFREMATLLKAAKFDVTLDNKEELFAANSCPDAALYAGWYALSNYRPCCQFAKGAVAWHLASGEAVTLRDAKSKAWCPNMLKAGVAATLGPVAEPYTIGFPKPSEFFGFLATGKYTLAEVHGRTVYFASWMTVLVGDPLYNPYKKHPMVAETAVLPSPKGASSLFR